MPMKIISRYALAASAGAAAAATASDAFAAASCDGLVYSGPATGIGNIALDQGDVVTITLNTLGTLGAETISVTPATVTLDLLVFVTPGDSLSTESLADGIYLFTGASLSDVTVFCSSDDAGVDAVEEAASGTVARATTAATIGLVSRRISSIVSDRAPSSPRAGGGSPATDGAGAAGQAESTPIGFWTNFALSGVSNSDSTTRSDTRVITGGAGVDTTIGDTLLLGGAVTYTRSQVETPADAFGVKENAFTVAPYAAYILTDRISIDGAVGYGVGFADIEKSQGAVVANTTSHRYFLTANVSHQNFWGNLGLLTQVNGLWSQSFQNAYRDSAGDRTSGQRFDLGAFTLRLEPSYFIEMEEFAIEPYASFAYSYDVIQTKTQGATNDPDALSTLFGIAVYYGSISGSLEAETTLFRENQRSGSISATVRVDF